MVGRTAVVDIEWHSPSFVWEEALKDISDKNFKRFNQPTILRFDSDSFMEELLEQLNTDPSGLTDSVACFETWRNKRSTWLSEEELQSARIPKLYQPAHGFFYMVTASLVCRKPVFPDKNIDTGNDERVSFVIRRLVEAGKNDNGSILYNEYARVVNEQGTGWRRVNSKDGEQVTIYDDEERIPLFSLNFTQDGKTRRLLAGLIPVANRERYQAGPKFTSPGNQPEPGSSKDPRMALFNTRIVQTMNILAKTPKTKVKEEEDGTSSRLTILEDKQARTIFIQIILDMAEFLKSNMDVVWRSLSENTEIMDMGPKKNLSDMLKNSTFYSDDSWSDVLIKDEEALIPIVNNLRLEDPLNPEVPLQPAEYIQRIIDNLDPDYMKSLVMAVLALDPMDPRLKQFEDLIADTLVNLRETITENALSDEQARQAFIFILLDFAQFLHEHLSDVWNAIILDNWTEADNHQKTLYDTIVQAGLYGQYHLDDALRGVWDNKAGVITGQMSDPLYRDLTGDIIVNAIQSLGIVGTDYRHSSLLYRQVKNALGTFTPVEENEDEGSVSHEIDPAAGSLYRIYCVYDRPRCPDIYSRIVSIPTLLFQLAPFYDPDAPGRPVRIPMPVDTSIAGLKKFPKNVSILISRELRNQMERVDGIKMSDLDEGNVNDEGTFDLGMVCSLSIPIITICALIFLMILVQLLNIIFWWLPFFKICFPLNLKAE